MSSNSSTPSPVTGNMPKPKKRPRGNQFGAAGVENPSVSRSKDVAASKGKKRANKATSNKKTYKKRRTNNLKKKEEEAEDRRKDVERPNCPENGTLWEVSSKISQTTPNCVDPEDSGVGSVQHFVSRGMSPTMLH